MSGYQFFHLEAYSFSGSNGCPGNPKGKTKTARAGKQPRLSIKQIADEALRRDGACPHITHPQPPDIMGKVDLDGIINELKQRAVQAKDKRGRKMRKDKLLLMAGVASYPVRMAELDLLDPVFCDWKQRTLDYLKARWGDQLRAELFHYDEEFPHLHFYVIPDDLDMASVHPGVKAGQDAPPNKSKQAHNAALSALQDDYYDKVSQYVGLTRLGPKRRRLTRSEWKSEKATALLVANCLQRRDAELVEGQNQLSAKRKIFSFAKSALSLEKGQLEAKAKRLNEEAKLISTSRELLRLKESSILVHALGQAKRAAESGEVERLRREAEAKDQEIAKLKIQLAALGVSADGVDTQSASLPHLPETTTMITPPGWWGGSGPK